jgi:DNA-binding Lrp family transcriptional regulator
VQKLSPKPRGVQKYDLPVGIEIAKTMDKLEVEIFRRFSPHAPGDDHTHVLRSPSYAAISRAIGASPASVKRRFDSLKHARVLNGISIEVDPECFGLSGSIVTMLRSPGQKPLTSEAARVNGSVWGKGSTKKRSAVQRPPLMGEPELNDVMRALPYLDFVDFFHVGRVVSSSAGGAGDFWLRFEVLHRGEEELKTRIGLLEKSLKFGRLISVSKHKRMLKPNAKLSTGEKELLCALVKSPEAEIQQLASFIGVDRKTVRRRLRKLSEISAFRFRPTLDSSRITEGMVFILYSRSTRGQVDGMPSDLKRALGSSWLTLNNHYEGELSITAFAKTYAEMMERYRDFASLRWIGEPMLINPVEKLANPSSMLTRPEALMVTP